jgi:ubiquinol-cytochrome c reductase cytochrome b subunit
MKALCSWFNDRTGFGDWCGWLADAPVPGRACWCKVLPCTVLFAFCVQAITGFFLWVYYSPSAQTAWESVYFLQYEVAGGWLLRAMHHYSAHVLLALLMISVVQSILTGAYRAPRELVFWATVGLGLCALAAILTGDLLSWDQNGYASTKTRTGFLAFLPLVGDSLLKIAIGGPGPALGHLTLTRFFALHVGVFAAAFIVLLLVRGVLARRASAAAAAAGDATPTSWDGSCTAVPYWPGQAWRSAVAALAVLVVIVLLACQHGVTPPEAGAALLSPADTDPANGYNAARPEWFLVGVYEFSHLFPGELAIIPIFIVPGLLVCIVLLMPFLAKHIVGHAFNVLFTVAVLVGLAAMSYYSLAKDRDNAEHQKAIALERGRAERVCELVRHEGIPPTGALTLLRNDPKTQGRRLFVQNCASCHDHAQGGDLVSFEDIKAEKSFAPNLYAFASRQWIAGLLDPKRVNGPEYFGNTKFRGGKMAGFVKDNLGDLDADQKKNLAKVIAAVSAEAKLPSQRDLDARDAKIIEEGRKLLVEEFDCTSCHKFHAKPGAGAAPELTGYGSPQWIGGIIRNPAERRFYGKLNDRMPAYAASADAAQNALDSRQIEMLTNWLRGQWYEEGQEERE